MDVIRCADGCGEAGVGGGHGDGELQKATGGGRIKKERPLDITVIDVQLASFASAMFQMDACMPFT